MGVEAKETGSWWRREASSDREGTQYFLQNTYGYFGSPYALPSTPLYHQYTQNERQTETQRGRERGEKVILEGTIYPLYVQL